MNGQKPPAINVNFTQGDILVCSCGSEAWTQTNTVCKVKNPMIGGTPPELYVGVKVLTYICSMCGVQSTDLKNKVKRQIELDSQHKPEKVLKPDFN